MADLQDLIPKSKFDTDAVARAKAAGFPTIEPILPDLLKWIRDGNWPVAGWTFALLASVGAPVVPHIRRVLSGEDDVWKYWCLSLVGDLEPATQRTLCKDLLRIARSPTSGEIEEGVQERAVELLADLDSPAG